ncbi:MAG: hypothetical protein WA317_05595 [Mycobacterium sp.]|uniref:hypothetical protein n=1 Tax=Mycobacterium sp. TaxID=1785 RepID=UPI003CC64B96
MPRSRGALTGLILVLLGAWGALIPFVGPQFDFAYTPDTPWVWTAARGWLEVFPGVVTVLGGLLLISSRNRATAMFGGWLAVLGGAWFVVGTALAPALHLGDVGQPVASTDGRRALLEIAYFSGLGALIVFFGGGVLARLSVRTARDVEPYSVPPAAEEPVSAPQPVASEVSPDAATQAGHNPLHAPETEPRQRRGLLRRRRAGV